MVIIIIRLISALCRLQSIKRLATVEWDPRVCLSPRSQTVFPISADKL